jgi:hypothetical protein
VYWPHASCAPCAPSKRTCILLPPRASRGGAFCARHAPADTQRTRTGAGWVRKERERKRERERERNTQHARTAAGWARPRSTSPSSSPMAPSVPAFCCPAPPPATLAAARRGVDRHRGLELTAGERRGVKTGRRRRAGEGMLRIDLEVWMRCVLRDCCRTCEHVRPVRE